MVETLINPSVTLPGGQIIALDVSAEDYLEQYAEHHYEWVKGVVVKMAPVSAKHDDLTGYLRELFRAYFALHPIGIVRSEPFVLRIETTPSYREPDLQVILNDNPGELTDTAMIGPADICIEVVSPGSVAIDHGEKFEEYEAAGVREYWIVDPLREECRFYRLQESGRYATFQPDEADTYHTPLLPHFALHVPTLWQSTLPDFFAVGKLVQGWFTDET
ncbi:MAG: Uma2 family endonuclease [Anaerolineae bacterium]|nr:Uma2 family endonuclease [Anaerolineae bacterium]